MPVRSAVPDDVPLIREIAREAWHAAYDDIVGREAVEDQVDEWYAPEEVRAGIRRADSYVVVERDGVPVGYAFATVDGDDSEAATLGAIYVRPERWGEGVGTRLLARVADDLAAAGAERLSASVLADNGVGLSFYERLGFRIDERGTTTVGRREVEEVTVVADVTELDGDPDGTDDR